jgi:hypothetical protein
MRNEEFYMLDGICQGFSTKCSKIPVRFIMTTERQIYKVTVWRHRRVTRFYPNIRNRKTNFIKESIVKWGKEARRSIPSLSPDGCRSC